MFFLVSFYIALAIFVAGTLYKIFTWFFHRTGPSHKEIKGTDRVNAALKGIFSTIASKKLLTLIKVFLFDGLLQLRILRESFSRWLMHIFIFAGFMLLFLIHALDSIITSNFFPQYMSTLNPFWFLRDLFGIMVIFGIIIAIYRRFIRKNFYLINNFQDRYAIIIIAVILLSGILLNGLKITSYTDYQDMVYSYMGGLSDEDQDALEAYWVENFGVVAPHKLKEVNEKTLEMGKELHDMSCASCHSSSQSAPLSYGTAKFLSPIATFLDKLPTTTIFWYIHYLASLFLLAYLPFSKMFHMLTGPASLMVNAVMDENSDTANIATRQALELDACTNCGICTLNCSMKIVFETIPNLDIFPSKKIKAIKYIGSKKFFDNEKLRDLREGLLLCTNCRRCTNVCPVGINLQDMWFNVREKLFTQGYNNDFFTLSPLSFYRSLMNDQLEGDRASRPAEQAMDVIEKMFPFKKESEQPVSLPSSVELEKEKIPGGELSKDTKTFAYCFGCQICTTACPVTASYDNAEEALGLLPHQIMHCLALEIREKTLGSGMLWSCLTCYQCQEQCPQGVKITDIFYELKNLAIMNAKIKEKEKTKQTKEYS